MKKQITISMVLVATFLAPVSARERGGMDYPDYKCHVTLENGAEHIARVSAKNLAMAEIHVAKLKVAITKKEKIAVKSVLECKAKAESFTSTTARTLELNTPD